MTQAGFFALLGTMSFIPGGNIPTSQRRSMIGLCRNAARDGIWQKGNTMIHHLDHLVLTTTNEQACVDFYVGLLGMALTTFGDGRKAFRFGQQKINVHVKGAEFEPKAHLPVPGALEDRKSGV